jgi:hypothetical protein
MPVGPAQGASPLRSVSEIPLAYQMSMSGSSAAVGAIERADSGLAPDRGEGAAPTTNATVTLAFNPSICLRSMTADIESLVLEQLRAIQTDVADVKHRLGRVKLGLSTLGQHELLVLRKSALKLAHSNLAPLYRGAVGVVTPRRGASSADPGLERYREAVVDISLDAPKTSLLFWVP